jgi:pilus assembly protein Flp/PilA
MASQMRPDLAMPDEFIAQCLPLRQLARYLLTIQPEYGGCPADTRTGSHIYREKIMQLIMRRWGHDEVGATAIEYAMIASMISILIVGGAAAIGLTLNGFFEQVVLAFAN